MTRTNREVYHIFSWQSSVCMRECRGGGVCVRVGTFFFVAGNICVSVTNDIKSPPSPVILAEGAIALPVTLSGGVLFAN